MGRYKLDGFYEVDGIFCSFECCLAFIQENKNIPLYVHSKSLLIKMYSEMYNEIKVIENAPSWRLLKAYGGNLEIDEFRASFNRITYNESYSLYSRLRTISKTYEKIEKL